MKNLISGLITLEIVLTIGIFAYQPKVESLTINHDERVGKLTRFMSAHNFAKPYYVKDYLESADRFGNDFAILPCIDLLESSGGRFYPRSTHNRWGFGSATGLYKFESEAKGIDYISQQLSNGHFYTGKTLKGKITTYNSANPNYYPNFIRCFNEIHNLD